MNRTMTTLARLAGATAVAMALLTAPVAEAQVRGRQASTQQVKPAAPASNKQTQAVRPIQNNRQPAAVATPIRNNAVSNNNRPGGNQGNGAVSNGNRPGNTNPGNVGNNGSSRPGGNAGNVSTPPPGNQNGNQNGNRPGNSNGFRPGGNNAPHPGNGGVKPGTPPGGPGAHPGNPPMGYQRPPMVRPGYRHPIPFFNNWSRPVPPPTWTYRPGYGPTFNTILGITLGATLNYSLNALFNSGYNVVNYGNNVVYLANVPQMNLLWPEAALYYNNGLLYASQFTYPSSYYDMSRYNTLYNVFMNQYGMPIQTGAPGTIASATWYGMDNRFVTLQFSQVNGNYYTTLSFGN